MLWSGGYLLRFYGKDCKTGLAKIITHLTNNSPSKKRFSNRPIRFPGSDLDSGEITGNVIGSARSKDLTAWARGLSPTSSTRSDAPCCWRARRPLASRVGDMLLLAHKNPRTASRCHIKAYQDAANQLYATSKVSILKMKEQQHDIKCKKNSEKNRSPRWDLNPRPSVI